MAAIAVLPFENLSDDKQNTCRENRDQSHLKIVSLDWGFNEQLAFLTDGPELSEPFWQFIRLCCRCRPIRIASISAPGGV